MGSIGPTQATIMLERMSKLVQATSVLVGTQVFKIVFPLRALVAQVGGAAASGERIRISFGFERLPQRASTIKCLYFISDFGFNFFFTLLSFSRSGLILSLIAGLIEMG